jgi:hypothetical protein
MFKPVLLLAFGLLSLTASPAFANEMTFRLVTLAGGRCGSNCPQVIAAQGEIVESTPDEFVEFVQSHVGGGRLHSVVLLDSPGGKVTASMELGRALRRLGAAVIVARPTGETSRTGDLLAGRCYSACVYALMGGRKRVVPPESRVGVHRMFNYVLAPDPAGGEPLRRRHYDDGAMRAVLMRYSRTMGVSNQLIAHAERTSPDRLHVLSPAEISRWRLGSGKF